MQQLALVGVLVRLFALYVGFAITQSLVLTLTSTDTWKPGSADWWMVLALLTALLIAVVLSWVFNLAIAQRLLAGRGGERALNLEGVGALEAALYACFGLWLVYVGVSGIGRTALMYLMFVQPDAQSAGQMLRSLGVEGIASAAQIIVGAFLMLRSQGLARLMQKLRGSA